MIVMHPLMVLVAFTLAALVTYAVVLGALTAASAVGDEPGDETREDELDVEDQEERGRARAVVRC